ncbi:Npun_F0494 family protein [Cyanobium gracile]|uniref:Uncharacterized protein n=1 Tax=Cyanobium gracile (strain ATCC 27147 / PCC 6307) TaxID=292564 RepID=K9P5W5_CYAGP|nr:Npun_F0494 family protein [Cyanobium gracile]AFY28353.1 hypothetical protein Cyagr_1174 [Cyanobium gracile PCC 6307]
MAQADTESRSLARAALSLRCLPFRRRFYEAVGEGPLSSTELVRRAEGPPPFTFLPLSGDRTEDHFLWLIRLGVLRREVDGQGLTERVRLTPMGRQVLRRWSGEIPRAGRRERILEALRRHRPRL